MRNRPMPILLVLLVGVTLFGCVAAEKPGPRRSTILFAGDTSYGENYQQAEADAGRVNILETEGYDYSFLKLDRLLRGSDLVVANLETPVTDLERSPLVDKSYVHWSDVDKTPAGLRRHHIEIVSLANNHAMDFGQQGLAQTLAVLSDARIESFGAGATEGEASAPWRRDIRVGERLFPLRILGAQAYTPLLENLALYAEGDRPGLHLLDKKKTVEILSALKRAEPDSFVVVFPHWGENYRWRSGTQQRMAHKLVDAGADLILGHGAHMLQEIEQYNGTWIAYSIGNLMFNSVGRYARFRAPPYSLPVQLIIEREDERWKKTLRFYPIVSDNTRTRYQPRPVTETEFAEVYEMLGKKSGDPAGFRAGTTTGKDEIGQHIEVRLD